MVSIIVPTYNNEKYIESALQSIFNQTYKDIEIIVVDDGSTDNTSEVLKKYTNKIIYIKKENGGVASARNLGLNIANGEYIAFLDADDLYDKNKIEKQVKILKKCRDIDVIYNNADVIDENSKYINTLRSEGVYKNKNNFLCMMLTRQLIPAPASIMLRKKCLEDGIRYNDNYLNAEDYDFILKLAERYKYEYIDESLYLYRRHKKNLTNNHNNQLKSEIDIIKALGIEKIKFFINSSTFRKTEKKIILAKIYMKMEMWNEAKKVLEIIKLKRKNKLIYFYLGNCCYVLQKYNTARYNYLKAIRLDYRMAEAHNNLGCTYGILGNIKKAKNEFNKAANIRKNYNDARVNIEFINNLTNFKLTTRELRKELTIY
ncbi:glycosyltransferase [uncultured Clostridium sp.]|uniref:glycosyltransferase n=1 Tax=uncultured Clostridium sp. TaxID=59620 RepID=UPI0028E5C6D9|nr:glycosyltransferase [uncultured Clostridium sp.]